METTRFAPETNSKFAPENRWLEYDPFPFGEVYFQGRAVSFREGCFPNAVTCEMPIQKSKSQPQ